MNRFTSNATRGGRRLAATLLVAGVAIAGLAPARAGSFEVSPVNVALAADAAATSLTLRNSDREPVSVRVLAYKWTQVDGRDVYFETRDVIASPPIFTVAAGARQLVRIGLRTRTPGAAYRVILEEIPREKPAGTGIQVALRLNLPLYVLNKAGRADVKWATWRGGAGEVVVEARNLGTLHSQVLEIGSIDAGGKKTILSKEMGVVLPGGARRWKIAGRPEFAIGAPLLLAVRGPGGEVRSKVLVEGR